MSAQKLAIRGNKAIAELKKFIETNCSYAISEQGTFFKELLKPEHREEYNRHYKRVKKFKSRITEVQFNDKYYNSPDSEMIRRQEAHGRHFGLKSDFTGEQQ